MPDAGGDRRLTAAGASVSHVGHVKPRRYLLRTVLALALGGSLWLISSEPWGLSIFQLIMFTAPGALLGMGAGWAAHATQPHAWNWSSARHSAAVGAIALPPVLAVILALDGSAAPQRLLVGFVYAAWVALFGGAVVALVHHRRGPV